MQPEFSMPPGATEDAAIEAAIALHQGYQWRVAFSGCRVLIAPDGFNGNPADILPLSNGSEVICGDWNHYVPRPMTNKADAFSLIQFVAGLPGYSVEVEGFGKEWRITVFARAGSEKVQRPKPTIDTDLLKAISLACLDALKARNT